MALFVKRDHKDSWLNVETLFPSYSIWLTHVRHFLFRSADCTAAASTTAYNSGLWEHFALCSPKFKYNLWQKSHCLRFISFGTDFMTSARFSASPCFSLRCLITQFRNLYGPFVHGAMGHTKVLSPAMVGGDAKLTEKCWCPLGTK